jgi:hypothetical protein
VFNRTVERSSDPVSVAAYCNVLYVLKQEGCPNLRAMLTKWTMNLLTLSPFNTVVPASLVSGCSGCFRILQDASGCFRMLHRPIVLFKVDVD